MTTLSKIFISGYPLTMEEMDLAQLVGPHGEIATIKLVRDKATRKPKGYAFIEMANPEAAAEVVAALHGVPLQDKVLTVTIVEEKPVTSATLYQKVRRAPDPIKRKRPRLPK
ncbi:RNA recognition motif domain-containing protein [Mucilaginibacter aquariorum]|uniref:RNA-binding protein n=1 Tax=Mucilaginibacter aquariorum TaxID=2967225 RepID=A0ABT1T2E3_9SPHI|nr:RNA-binding protein [Mucilaginibacter aquariorum]MCQ6958764.1 RNA-binding protein [Mucilaginibacter aquariorum]